jgi:hypothetical protein
VLAADKTGQPSASHRFEATLGCRYPLDRPGLDRLGQTLGLMPAECLQPEPIADQLAGGGAIITTRGSASACKRAPRFGVSPTTACQQGRRAPPRKTGRLQARRQRPAAGSAGRRHAKCGDSEITSETTWSTLRAGDARPGVLHGEPARRYCRRNVEQVAPTPDQIVEQGLLATSSTSSFR